MCHEGPGRREQLMIPMSVCTNTPEHKELRYQAIANVLGRKENSWSCQGIRSQDVQMIWEQFEADALSMSHLRDLESATEHDECARNRWGMMVRQVEREERRLEEVRKKDTEPALAKSGKEESGKQETRQDWDNQQCSW